MTIPSLDLSFHNLSANIAQDVRINPDGLRTFLQEVHKTVIRSKNDYAVANSVHMDTELNLSVRGLAALNTSDATQDEVNARANLLKAVAVVHAANVGSATEDGAHKTADATAIGTLVAVPAASNLATSITLITALMTWLKAHGIESNVHFTNDAALSSLNVTTHPPSTLAQCRVDLNDLSGFFQAHFVRAAP